MDGCTGNRTPIEELHGRDVWRRRGEEGGGRVGGWFCGCSGGGLGGIRGSGAGFLEATWREGPCWRW